MILEMQTFPGYEIERRCFCCFFGSAGVGPTSIYPERCSLDEPA